MKVFLPRSFSIKSATAYSNFKYVNQAKSGKDNFEKDFQNCHVQTNFFQKILLGVGSGVISITSPSRGDMVAVMGEVTGPQALRYIQSKMEQSDEGRKILKEKPRISSGAVDLENLKTYPPGTLGKAYSNFLSKYEYTPDSRNAVKFVDDLELAYVAQRYREVHDLFHTLLDMPTNMLGEVTVKWVEAIQTKLPMCAAGALFGSVRLAPKFVRRYSTKAVVEIYPELVEKFERGEIKQSHYVKETKLNIITLPEPIQIGIKSVLGLDRKRVFEDSKKLENHLLKREVPLEESDKILIKEKISEKLSTEFPENFEENETLNKKYQSKLNRLFASYTYSWKPTTYTRSIGLQYLMCRAPVEYAAVRQVFNEIYIRDKNFSPITYFDFGSGVGTAVWAAHNLWGSSLKEYICIDTSKEMNNLGEMILKNNNPDSEPYIKNVHYRQFLSKTLTSDIVVSAFTFFELRDQETRLRTLTYLWNNTNKYLILIENGTNAGYRLLMEARSYLLAASKKYGIDCHIFAPCPHDSGCPRLSAPGKPTPCNFIVNYTNIFKFKGMPSVDTQTYSYIIFKKGKAPLKNNRESRIIRGIHRRHHCVTCQLCTNHRDLQTIYVSRGKYGKEVYKLFTYLQWGNLIPGTVNVQKLSVDKREYISDKDSDDDSTDEEVGNCISDGTSENTENAADRKT